MQNEKEWFCNQVKACEKCMYMVAYSTLGNEEDTKDAMQDAIMKAYSNLHLLRDKSKFKSWMMKIVLNTTMDIAKKRNRLVLVEELEEDLESYTNPDYVKNISLKDAVKQLKHPYRTVVILYYYQALSIKEISDIMDTNVPSVKKQLQRAREQLKRMM